MPRRMLAHIANPEPPAAVTEIFPRYDRTQGRIEHMFALAEIPC